LNHSSETPEVNPLEELAFCEQKTVGLDQIRAETQQISALPTPTRPSWFLRFWRLMLVFLVMAHLFQIRFGILRLAMAAAAVVLWLGVLPLFGKVRWVKVAWVIGTILAAALFLGPGHPDNPQALRQEYVRSLLAYMGDRYVWGGENSRGVDCSGLVRAALIDADVNRGISTRNPALIREACALWWFDCSADALRHEYRHNTVVEFDAHNLNEIDYAHVLPGDLAVTGSGQHVLAYIGYYTWIEADPNSMRVETLTAPSKSVWFDQQMRIVRWRQLR
jgi:hypothetical protein